MNKETKEVTINTYFNKNIEVSWNGHILISIPIPDLFTMEEIKEIMEDSSSIEDFENELEMEAFDIFEDNIHFSIC